MATSNDELSSELKEMRRLIEELHARPTVGHLISKLIDRFAKPQMLLSSAVLLAVMGLLAGKAVPMTLEGFGFTFSTAEKANERRVEKSRTNGNDDSDGVFVGPPAPEPVLRAIEARDERNSDVPDDPPPDTDD